MYIYIYTHIYIYIYIYIYVFSIRAPRHLHHGAVVVQREVDLHYNILYYTDTLYYILHYILNTEYYILYAMDYILYTVRLTALATAAAGTLGPPKGGYV